MATYFALLFVVLFASTLSGVFGMAGGMVLMGALAYALPVSAAMVTHGAVQFVSNGWRAILHRRHVSWRIVGHYAIGSTLAALILVIVTYQPTKAWVYLWLGLAPITAWIPKRRLHLDAARRPDAILCGFLVSGMNVAAGVSGPLIDVFFVRTGMTRHSIVATKAATQTFAHSVKVIFYGAPLLTMTGLTGMPPLWFFAVAAPLAMLGAVLGGYALDLMSDTNFLKWTRWIVTGFGLVFLAQAAFLFLAPTLASTLAPALP